MTAASPLAGWGAAGVMEATRNGGSGLPATAVERAQISKSSSAENRGFKR
jgi:hypothetical protein